MTATADKLDDMGMVTDFKVLKTIFGGWIDAHWDHAFLWYEKDPVGHYLFNNTYIGPVSQEISEMKNFRCQFNPTSENLTEYLLTQIAPKLMEGTGVTIEKIQLLETENCDSVSFIAVEGPETDRIPTLTSENAL